MAVTFYPKIIEFWLFFVAAKTFFISPRLRTPFGEINAKS